MSDIAQVQPQDESFIGRFMVLRGAMPELWVTFTVKFLAVAAYQVMNFTIVLWLSTDLGFSEQRALGLVAGWSLLMTVLTILVGSLTDAIGLRRTFLVGICVCIIARAVMTFTTMKWLALGAGLFPLAMGEALGSPVLVAAIRRYSTTAQRSISFSLFYTLMNLGFLVSYYIFDWVREAGALTLPWAGLTLSLYQTVFLASLVIEVLLLPVIYFGIRAGAEATDAGVRITPEQPRYPHTGTIRSLWLTLRDTAVDTVRNFAALGRHEAFYRLIGFLVLISFVKLIFMQMYYAYPTFGIRELGKDAPVGRLWAINSYLIIFLVPVVGVFTQKLSAYRVVTIGSAISAASVFVLTLPAAWFQPMANSGAVQWLAHGYLGLTGGVNPWYVMIFFYVLALSVGEAFYSPRVYEYASAIAPKGQEASYASLSYVPFFVAKLIVGVVSGKLLAWYCPETGPRNSQTMWLVIALITTICPVGLILFRRWIRVPEAGRTN